MRLSVKRHTPPPALEVWDSRDVASWWNPHYGAVAVDWVPAIDPWLPGAHAAPAEMACFRYVFTFESCGYYNGDTGQRWEWWNVIHDGKIIEMLWYEPRRNQGVYP